MSEPETSELSGLGSEHDTLDSKRTFSLAESQDPASTIMCDENGSVTWEGNPTFDDWTVAWEKLDRHEEEDPHLLPECRTKAMKTVEAMQQQALFVLYVEQSLEDYPKEWERRYGSLWTPEMEAVRQALAKAMDQPPPESITSWTGFRDYKVTEAGTKMIRYAHAIYDRAYLIPPSIRDDSSKDDAKPEIVEYLKCLKPTWDKNL